MILVGGGLLFGINAWSSKTAGLKRLEREKNEQVEKDKEKAEKKRIQEETKGDTPKSEYEEQMLTAGQKYWSEKYSGDGAKVILKNFSCHTGLEVLKNGETVARLNYDGTNITEINI